MRKTTWIVDIYNNFAFTQGPDLTYKREYFGCTTFLHPNGTTYSIVAGSLVGSVEGEDTTEILSLETNMDSWFDGMYFLTRFLKVVKCPNICCLIKEN